MDARSVLAYLSQVLSNDPPLTPPVQAVGEAEAAVKSGNQSNTRSGLALDFWTSQSYAERRLRDRVFNDPGIFGEPAWDALLDIARAEAGGERLAVTSACIGSCAPTTTALRHLKILEQRCLIRREGDSSDARRSFLRLTEEGRKRLGVYFLEVRNIRSSRA
jgi:hypothetical protein